MKSKITNCIIRTRNSAETLFTIEEDGRAIINLDGYAVIPKEEIYIPGADTKNPDFLQELQGLIKRYPETN